MDLSKYISYVLLRNDKESLIKKSDNSIFDSLGLLTERSACSKEASSIYSIFWYAYLFNDGLLKFNCSISNGNGFCIKEIDSRCFLLRSNNHAQTKNCDTIHVAKPPCQDLEQSKTYKFSQCCSFVNSFTENFEATMKIMKYFFQAIHHQESFEEEKIVFENITQAFKKSAFIAKHSSAETRRNFNMLIPLCQYAEYPRQVSFSSCNLFKRSFSNLGLSYTFNAERFWEMFQKTEYNAKFERIMAPNKNEGVRYPESSGSEYRLRFVLNGIHLR